jgi:hypothetical protein
MRDKQHSKVESMHAVELILSVYVAASLQWYQQFSTGKTWENLVGRNNTADVLTPLSICVSSNDTDS